MKIGGSYDHKYLHYYYLILCFILCFVVNEVNSQLPPLQTCLSCGIAYCPETGKCVISSFNNTCLCSFPKTQCHCMAKIDPFNCTSTANCTWLSCTQSCVPTNTVGKSPICLSCPDTLDLFPLQLALGIGLPLAIFFVPILLRNCLPKVGPIKRRIFHVIFNICSLGSSGILNYCTFFYLPTLYASKLCCLVGAATECFFLISSWAACFALPTKTGKLKRSTSLDTCSKKYVYHAYFVYLACYLLCVSLWAFAYTELTHLLGNSPYYLWYIGLLLRLLPFVFIVLERIVSCVRACGVEVGASINPLFSHSSYEELK